jgi:hypothetical protein
MRSAPAARDHETNPQEPIAAHTITRGTACWMTRNQTAANERRMKSLREMRHTIEEHPIPRIENVA